MAPSAPHEARVELLATAAILSGCRSPVLVESGLRPDVAVADHPGRRLFVGNAKATETSACAATGRRLRRYLRAISPWRANGYHVRLVLCVEKGSGDWAGQLARLCHSVGAGVAVAGRTAEFGGDSELAWIDLPAVDVGSGGTTRATGSISDSFLDSGRCLDGVFVLPEA